MEGEGVVVLWREVHKKAQTHPYLTQAYHSLNTLME